MRLFSIGLEHTRDVSIERPQHADVCMHQEVATFCGADQATDCGLIRKMGSHGNA
jgi:hypothetical protein